VPLGAFLSGGLDSSVVVLLLAEILDRPLKTFSVGFDTGSGLDEREFARRVSREYGTEHHELVVSPNEVAEHLPRLVEHVAAPVMDPALIPTFILSRFARREVTVVLTGEGADELFGGYRRHLYQHRYGRIATLPGVRALAGTGGPAFLPHRVRQALQALSETRPAACHLKWSSTIGRQVGRSLFDRELYDAWETECSGRFAAHFGGGSLRLGDLLRADLHEWLPHDLLAKVDLASMAVSLEARVPYLDHRIVEWAVGLPDRFRIRGGATKYILRKAFERHIPASVLRRPKQGFDLPLAEWIRGPLAPMACDLLQPGALARWPGISPAVVREMLDRHLRGEQDFGLPLFNVLSVMIYLDRRPRPAGVAEPVA
jgi:asparagine synthase (glutamine-hydrolysing)